MKQKIKAEYRPLPPAEAIAFFESKGYHITFDWYEMWQEAHDRAFTVAKAMRQDILEDIRAEVNKAISEGTTLSEFRANLEPTLQRKGWWGRKVIGDREVQLGSPYRLRTIFQTNVNVAYQAGRYKQMTDPDVLSARPYFMYDAVNDSRTRPQHLGWDGLVLPADDPFWDTHYPPNGWGCRCSVVSVSPEEMEAEDLTVSSRPGKETYEWVNPATGVVEDVPEGIDPGWAYNPGKDFAKLN